MNQTNNRIREEYITLYDMRGSWADVYHKKIILEQINQKIAELLKSQREEFEKEYHTKECLESEYINCICPKIPETESIKEQFIQQYKSEFPPNTEIFRGIIADWWLSKIDELLKSQREELVEKIEKIPTGNHKRADMRDEILSIIKE